MRDGKFGAHLKTLRLKRNMTQEVLAERSGLAVDSIRRIERGAFSPSLDTLGKLSGGLELSLSTLFSSAEAGHSGLVRELCDYLAHRRTDEIRVADRVLRALFGT